MTVADGAPQRSDLEIKRGSQQLISKYKLTYHLRPLGCYNKNTLDWVA